MKRWPGAQPAIERLVTAEPARVISVRNPWAWRIVTGLQTAEERPWKPSWRGVLWIHAGKDSDLSAPAELWPPASQLVSSAIIGHVTLADVEGRPGAWRWMLASPHQLAEQVTGVQGAPRPVAHRLAAKAFDQQERHRVDLAVPSRS
jgi:hypothetical protein